MLSNEDICRYERNIIVPEIGQAGQERLRGARIMVIGAGGLGSAVLLYLTAAGVGQIAIYDGDTVSLSNLQRQIIHSEDRLQVNKAQSAGQTLQVLNSHTQLEVHGENFDPAGCYGNYDGVVVCTDNFESRLEVNRWAVAREIPTFHAGVKEWFGHVFTFVPGIGPCFECLFADAEGFSMPSGVVGPVVGVMGCLQSVEVIKYLIGSRDLLTDKILYCDLLRMQFDLIPVKSNPDCRVCGKR
ncbi:MAG: HesA/MoeB/ThiF family protein [Ignavibacteriales bacterium]